MPRVIYAEEELARKRALAEKSRQEWAMRQQHAAEEAARKAEREAAEAKAEADRALAAEEVRAFCALTKMWMSKTYLSMSLPLPCNIASTLRLYMVAHMRSLTTHPRTARNGRQDWRRRVRRANSVAPRH